jgi:hypothetical protein
MGYFVSAYWPDPVKCGRAGTRARKFLKGEGSLSPRPGRNVFRSQGDIILPQQECGTHGSRQVVTVAAGQQRDPWK